MVGIVRRERSADHAGGKVVVRRFLMLYSFSPSISDAVGWALVWLYKSFYVSVCDVMLCIMGGVRGLRGWWLDISARADALGFKDLGLCGP